MMERSRSGSYSDHRSEEVCRRGQLNKDHEQRINNHDQYDTYYLAEELNEWEGKRDYLEADPLEYKENRVYLEAVEPEWVELKESEEERQYVSAELEKCKKKTADLLDKCNYRIHRNESTSKPQPPLQEPPKSRTCNVKLISKQNKIQTLQTDICQHNLALHFQKLRELELMKDVKCRDQKMKTIEAKLRKTTIERDDERHIRQDLEKKAQGNHSDLKKKEYQISEQRNHLQETLTQLRLDKAKLNEIQSERENERHTRQYLEKKARENHTRNKELEQNFERAARENHSDLKERENYLSEQRNQLKQALTKLKQVEATLNETKSERDLERHTRQCLEGKAHADHIRIQELEQVNDIIASSQKQRIENLETEVERRDLKIKALKESVDNKKTKALNEREFISDLKKMEDQLSEQRNQTQQALIKLKQTEDKLKETTSERDLERLTRQNLEGKVKENQTIIKELEQIHEKIVIPQKQRIQNLEREVNRHDLNEKWLEEIMKNRTTEALNKMELISDLRKKEDQLSEHRNQLQHALTKLKQVEATLYETKFERDIEHHTRQDLEGKAKANYARIQELEQMNDKIASSYKQRIDNLEKEVKRRDLKLKALEESVADRKIEDLIEIEFINNLKKMEDQLSEQRNQTQQALIKLKKRRIN